MKFSASKIELIEKYYNESLTSEELEFFNEQLLKDVIFSEEVKQFKFIFKGIDRERSIQLKRDFEKMEREILPSTINRSSIRSIFRQYSSAAAAFTLVLVVGISLLTSVNTENSNENKVLYAKYFKPYPNVIAPLTRSATQKNTAIYLAMIQYDSKQYNDAILEFDQLLKQPKLKNEILFYKAVSLMSEGFHEEAKVQLEKMDEFGNFKHQRKWYLALTLLQLKELDKTEVILKEIVKDYSSFSIFATELLEEFFSQE
mgnify:CR=1 FL=1